MPTPTQYDNAKLAGGPAAARVNLMLNPSIEEGTVNWQTFGANIIEATSEQVFEGSLSLKATYQNHNALAAHFGGLILTPQNYIAEIWVYIPSDWDGGIIKIVDSGTWVGAVLDLSRQSADMGIRDAWQRITLEVNPDPADLAGTVVFTTTSAPTVGRFVYFDFASMHLETGLWVRCSIKHENTTMISTAGTRAYRMEGVLLATIKAPLTDGDFDDRDLAKTIRAAFEGKIAEDVNYGSATVSPVRRNGRWYEMEVEIPFRSDFSTRPTLGSESGVVLDPVEVGDSIRTWFGDQVEGPDSLPTLYDDAPFTQPDTARWVRFTILEGGSVAVENRGGFIAHRTTGLAIAQIFVQLGIGDGLALQTADTIADAFRSVSVDGISFRAPVVSSIGEGRDGKWWQVNVACPFSYETLTS
jgi:hypothetical protein